MVESVAHQHRKFWLVFSCLPLQLTHFEQSENLFYLLVSLSVAFDFDSLHSKCEMEN